MSVHSVTKQSLESVATSEQESMKPWASGFSLAIITESKPFGVHSLKDWLCSLWDGFLGVTVNWQVLCIQYLVSSSQPYKAELLSTIDIWVQVIINEGCAVHHRTVSQIPGFYPPNAKGTYTTRLCHTKKMSPDIAKWPLQVKVLSSENQCYKSWYYYCPYLTNEASETQLWAHLTPEPKIHISKQAGDLS